MVATTDAGSRYLLQNNLFTLGWAALGTGKFDLARDHISQSMRIAVELASKDNMVWNLHLFAWLEGQVGDLAKSIGWLGLIRSLEIYQNRPDMGQLFDRILEEIRGGMSEDEVEALMNRGAELKLDNVVEKIVEESGKRTEGR